MKKLTRVEVIGNEGIEQVYWTKEYFDGPLDEVWYDFQDDGKTLKIFLKDDVVSPDLEPLKYIVDNHMDSKTKKLKRSRAQKQNAKYVISELERVLKGLKDFVEGKTSNE